MDTVKYLMGAYFHQDWVLDGGSSSDRAWLNEIRDQMHSFLSTSASS